MRERLKIGEAARLVGVTPKTVRHYEKIGLPREPARSESGYRLYSANDLLRLPRGRCAVVVIAHRLSTEVGSPPKALTMSCWRTAPSTKSSSRRR